VAFSAIWVSTGRADEDLPAAIAKDLPAAFRSKMMHRSTRASVARGPCGASFFWGHHAVQAFCDATTALRLVLPARSQVAPRSDAKPPHSCHNVLVVAREHPAHLN
jgi:hypothetical protein